MRKEWFSAVEIAALALPGLPTSERGVQRFADREGWNDHAELVRKRQGRGGGVEYHFRLLPTIAQAAHARAALTVGDRAAANDEPSMAKAEEDLTGRARLERDSRLAVVQAFERFAKGLPGLKQASHLQMFTDQYQAGFIKVDDWVKDCIPSVSKRSLLRWRSAAQKGQGNTLAVDRAQSRKGKGLLHTANAGKVRAYVLALIAQQPFLSAAHVRTLCRAEFGDTLVTAKGEKAMPPERTFQHFLMQLKRDHKVELTKLRNPDLFRSTMRTSGTNSLAHVRLANQLWQIDASPIDALCTDGRHSIYACVDIATRRACFLVSKTPRAEAVGLLIRKTILAWGVPETIKTDNGSDFVARATKRLFASLNIEMEVSDAYSPQQKGHVERLIKTFQHDFATLLPGYVGHSVADRKEIESRKSFAQRLGATEAETFGVQLTGQDIQALADQWAETIYHQRKHSGLKGESPFAAANRLSQGRRDVPERALDLLLMPVPGQDGLRTTTKFGVRVDGFHYATPSVLPATRVLVRQDPQDKGRVLLFEPDGGRYLGEGICPELAGIDPKTLVAATRELHGEMLDDATAQIRKNMRQIAKGQPLITRALEVAARDMPNVVPFKPSGAAHSTPQIEAAKTVTEGTPEQPADPALQAARRKLAEEMAAEAALHGAEQAVRSRTSEIEAERNEARGGNVQALPETAKDRYRRAVRIAREIEAGTADPRDAAWFGSYQTTQEFKAQKAVHEDFGDAYLGS